MCMHKHCKTIVKKEDLWLNMYMINITRHPIRVANMRTDQ